MLNVKNVEHLIDVLTFATENGATERLLDRLAWLSNFGAAAPVPRQFASHVDQLAWALTQGNQDGTVCDLYPDFSSNSFAFVLKHPSGATWFNGGLIYSGPGQPLDGSAPAFTVDIGSADRARHDWSVHT